MEKQIIKDVDSILNTIIKKNLYEVANNYQLSDGLKVYKADARNEYFSFYIENNGVESVQITRSTYYDGEKRYSIDFRFDLFTLAQISTMIHSTKWKIYKIAARKEGEVTKTRELELKQRINAAKKELREMKKK